MKDLVVEPKETRKYFLPRRDRRNVEPGQVMKDYDVYIGTWVPREYINLPGTKDILYTLWEFEPKSMRPLRSTRIPESEMEFYNWTRRKTVSGYQCNAMMPKGEVIQIFCEHDNYEDFKGLVKPQKVGTGRA